MKKLSPFMQRFDQLPASLPVFPLTYAMVMPGGNLPLNIFEPRYLNMLKDAMEGSRLIGMVQPRDEKSQPTLFNVGCAGRITRYEETHDGRLEITLTGLCRFEIKEELSTLRGYRLIVPDWSGYEIDYEDQKPPDAQSKLVFNGAIRSYFKQNNMEADWDSLDKLSIDELINSLFNYLPLIIEDKQLLIETDTLAHRLKAFTAILEGSNDSSMSSH